MKTIQFREAIAEAMSEERRRDEIYLFNGWRSAEYNGAYKASKGMLDEFGPNGSSIPDSKWVLLVLCWSAMNGNRPIIEFMTFFSLWG